MHFVSKRRFDKRVKPSFYSMVCKKIILAKDQYVFRLTTILTTHVSLFSYQLLKFIVAECDDGRTACVWGYIVLIVIEGNAVLLQ